MLCLLQKSDSRLIHHSSLKPNKNSANLTHPNQTRKMVILVQLGEDTTNHSSLSIKPNTPQLSITSHKHARFL